MNKTKIIGAATFVLGSLSFIILFTIVPQYQEEITAFTLKNPYLAPFIVILWRIIAIIIPPLPGGFLSLAFVPIVGWFWAYVYGEIGVLIGTTIAFFIARKFREPAVSKFVPLQELHKWENKLSKRQEFFAFLALRMVGGSFMDFLSYAAGLSKLSYRKFILATIIAELPVVIWYYLGEVAYDQFVKQGTVVGVIILVIAIPIIYYFVKNHGFFKKEIK